MQRMKPGETNLRRFVVSPRNRVLSSPKFELNRVVHQQEQRVRNYVYKKSNLLGKGYSSKVYKAYRSEESYKPFAMKVIDLSSLSYDQRKNLQLELSLQKSISHPNIVKCYETFKTTSAYYLVLEYCQNGTLADYMKSHKRLDQSVVINILSQIVQAYLHLADMKVLHRDLKPQNVLRKDNVWKITDFGFGCKLQGDIYEDDLNVGTPLYMPLESLIKNIYSHKSDIYSIGVIAYKMLTGSTPWKCSTEKELIQLMNTQKISFPLTKNNHLGEFLKKSLEMDAEKRINLEQFKRLYQKIKQEEAEIQRQSNLGSDLKKYESSRSSNTAVSTTTSKNEQGQISPRQMSFNSSFNSSHQTKELTQNINFAQNTLIISSELQTYRLIHHMLLNIDSFIVSGSIQNPESGYEIHCNTKEVLVTFFYKYVLKKVRMLNSYVSSKLNDCQQKELKILGMKDWRQYAKSGGFMSVTKLIKERLDFYEAEFLQSYIKKSILTIRLINKKFPQLGHMNLPLESKFYKNFLDFIRPEIQSLNRYILQNLQRAKTANKTMKKDRILAFSYWIRLYIQFLQKYEFLKETENVQPETQEVSKKQSESLAVNIHLEKLSLIKKSIKIEFLYNFKETNLEFKEFLSLRKKLSEIFQITDF